MKTDLKTFTAYGKHLDPKILRSKNMNKMCSDYIMLLNVYNEKKAEANFKIAKAPLSRLPKPVQREQPEPESVFHHSLIRLLGTKTILFKALRQSFSFLVN